MDTLATIVRQYDIIAIQEIKDAKGKVPDLFLAEVNKSGGKTYAMLASPRTGLHASDKSSQEQYIFLYDRAVIEPLGVPNLFDDSKDQFQREPSVAQFKVIAGNFTFVLATIHTDPDNAVAEIGALHDVVTWAEAQYSGEDDIIVLGDYNAGCDYAKPAQLDALDLRGAGFTWIVPDDADTNVATSKACAYDRIVITKGADGDYAGQWGIDPLVTDKAVSDHFPVWAEFYSGRDG